MDLVCSIYVKIDMDENSIAYSIRLGNGRFKIIPKSVYQDLKNIQEKTILLRTGN